MSAPEGERTGSCRLISGQSQTKATPHRCSAALDLSKDPGETTDLAAALPAILKELIASWATYAEQKGVILPPASAVAGQALP
jgi:hypothetical protein